MNFFKSVTCRPGAMSTVKREESPWRIHWSVIDCVIVMHLSSQSGVTSERVEMVLQGSGGEG
jgi:hypothetical protein